MLFKFNPYSNGRDPDQAIAAAERAGRDDGRKGFPRGSSSDTPAADNFGHQVIGVAESSVRSHKSDHFNGTRSDDDTTVGQEAATVIGDTTQCLMDVDEAGTANHTYRAYESLSLAERVSGWSKRIRFAAVGVATLGTGAALSGALLSVSSDEWYLVMPFAFGVTIASALLGSALAHLLRNFEFQHRRPGDFTSGIVPKILVALLAVFAFGLAVSVASIRGTAAKSDASLGQQAEGDAIQSTVTEPGSEDAVAATETDEQAQSVGGWTFFWLEGVLVCAVLGVEYLGYRPWSEGRDGARDEWDTAKATWQASRAKLTQSLGALVAADSVRADHDAAMHLLCEATLRFARAEIAAYRRANLATQPNLTTDPFPAIDDLRDRFDDRPQDTEEDDTDEAPPTLEAAVRAMDTIVTERWGKNLRELATVPVDRLRGEVALDEMVARTMARAVMALELTPELARHTRVVWDPAQWIDDALGTEPTEETTEPRRSGPVGVDAIPRDPGAVDDEPIIDLSMSSEAGDRDDEEAVL